MALQTQETEWRTAGEIAASEAEFLAREAARSGYDVGMSDVAVQYAQRSPRSGVSAKVAGFPEGGSYDLVVEDSSDATINVVSTGRARFINTEHDAETRQYQMKANIVRLAPAPGAVFIRANDVVPDFDGTDFRISGKDRRPGSTMRPGAAPNQYGLVALRRNPGDNPNFLANLFIGALSPQQRERVDGKIAQGATSPITPGVDNPDDLALMLDIYGEAMTRVGNGESDVLTYPGGTVFNTAEDFGSSPTNPMIVHVAGDATFTGDIDGHGILIVEGDLTIEGSSANPGENFAWSGLVFARKAGETTFVQSGSTRIDGALIVDSPLLVNVDTDVNFTITPGGTVTVNERFAARAEVLGAALSTGVYDMPVTLELEIDGHTEEPWGKAHKALEGNVNDNQNPRSFSFPNIYDGGTSIQVRARSFRKNREWKRKWTWSYGCYCWRYGWVYTESSGSSENDWYVYKDRASGQNNEFVRVLRNGDEVPDVTGWNGQDDVMSYVEDYVVDDHVVLEPNQAIYLFELYANDVNSSYADFQDVVVLLTLAKESASVANTPDGADPDSTNNVSTASLVNFSIADDATIQYSAEAIGRLAKRFATVSSVASTKALRQSSYAPSRGLEVRPGD